MNTDTPDPMPPLSEEEVQALEAQREQANENLRRKLAKVLPWSERAEA